MTLPSIESLLKKHRIHLKKKMGQHFLTRKPTIEKIVNALGIRHSDDVLEIGAGLGIMTVMMANHAHRVYAVEKDKNLASIFAQEFGEIENIDYISVDFLRLNLKKDLPEARFPLKVIGNIPYNISTPILFKLLENKALIGSVVLTMQQEVAKRILARPNCKDYGILTILTQTQAHAYKLFEIRPTCFIPPPEVMSTVIRLDFESEPSINIEDFDWFKKIVKAAFGQRRKTIKNALALARDIKIPMETIKKALETANIKEERRPETLLIPEYITLAHYLALANKPKK